MNQLPWRTAIRIAWREMRASRAQFLFVILAVAIGVGSLTGVRGFSRSFRHMLLREARTLMAGDIIARVFALPTASRRPRCTIWTRRGVRRTWITETVTMASSAATPDPLLISVKAVDPAAYPYYGVVKLDPPRPLREALDADSVVVSDDLLVRLNVHTGDTLRIGGQDFRIAGVVASEPDRMTGSLNVGPRVMITREGLDRTGLIGVRQPRRRALLFALPGRRRPRRRRGARGTEDRLSRSHHRRLPRDPPHHHARPGSRHHVPQPDRPDRAGDRRHGRGQRHARPPAAEAGFHRGDEVHRRALRAGDPHLYGADADARACRRSDRRGLRRRGGRRVSRADRQIFQHWTSPPTGIPGRPCRASPSPAW